MKKAKKSLVAIVGCLLIAGITGANLMAGNRWAMLIGISHYPQHGEYPSADDWGEIHGRNDVSLLSRVLQQQAFDPQRIITVTDSEATAGAIRQKLDWLNAVLQPGDMLYLHFSCHGQLVEDLNGDEEDGWDEALIPYDAEKCYRAGIYEGENHLCDDELHQRLVTLRTKLGPMGMLYVALDACHIGESYMNGETFRGTNLVFTPRGKQYVKTDVVRRNRSNHRPIERRANQAPICMLEACRAYELNMEKRVGDTYYGALSYYIAQVLSGESIIATTAWWLKVRQLLDSDATLFNQHLVIETSL